MSLVEAACDGVNMKNWQCPECDEINGGAMILCTCGYRDDELLHKENALVPPVVDSDLAPADRAVDSESKAEPKGTHHDYGKLSLYENWFKLSTWKDGYFLSCAFGSLPV